MRRRPATVTGGANKGSDKSAQLPGGLGTGYWVGTRNFRSAGPAGPGWPRSLLARKVRLCTTSSKRGEINTMITMLISIKSFR